MIRSGRNRRTCSRICSGTARSSALCPRASSLPVPANSDCSSRASWPVLPVIRIFMETAPHRAAACRPGPGGQLWRLVERPLDAELGVVPQQAALMLRRVVVGGLVEELGAFAEHHEAVCEAFGIHSWRWFCALRWVPNQRPKLGELLRRSTATSNTSPATTRTSFPAAAGSGSAARAARRVGTWSGCPGRTDA